MAGLLKRATGAVKKSVETVHSARVTVTHKIRGVREDGLLGKTELEARMYEAAKDERFGEAALIKERLEAIVSTTRAQQAAAAAKDFANAEALNHQLNVLRQREPFEALLAERAAERTARGDVRQKKVKKGALRRVASTAHNARVHAAFRVRGRRKDGGLGKTELEALAIEAEARGQAAQAGFLLLRAKALQDARDKRLEALAAGDAAQVAHWDAEIKRLRERAPFMAALSELHAAAAEGGDSSSDDSILGCGDTATPDGLFVRSLVYDEELHTAVELGVDDAVPSDDDGGLALDPSQLPPPLLSVTSATGQAPSAPAADGANSGAGSLAVPSTGGDSSYESFMALDADYYRSRGVSASDGAVTFGGTYARPFALASGSSTVGGSI